MQLSQVRSQFPLAQRVAYLNHAAVSPLATPTREAMEGLIAALNGEDARDWQTRFARIEEIRRRMADLVGAAATEIAFTKNTSEGLAMVAEGLDWRPGDRIVSFECEFPANLYPWLALRPRGVRVELLPEAAILDLDRLRAACRGARLLAISQVQYVSGLRADLVAIGAICRETGTLLVVDGIQGLGAFPLDVKQCGIHALSAGSHKWLMGPEGAGFLFLDGSVLDQVQPREVGWLSVAAWDDFNAALDPAHSGAPLVFRPGADRFECGMRNCLGIYGLGAAVALLTSLGIANVATHLIALGDRLAAGLAQRGWSLLQPSSRPEHRSGINSFRPSSDTGAGNGLANAAAVVARLEQHGVICSPRGDYVRVAPHCYNNADDIDRLLAVL